MSDTALAPILEIAGLKRVYRTRAGELEVLSGVDLRVQAGRMVGLVGPSGSGKSSLLHAAALLEAPQGGSVKVAGVETVSLSERERTGLRLQTIGFVYQFHNLLPELSARDNVALPQRIAGVAQGEARARADALLTRLGLAGRLDHQPAQLSGGEQQRVAIARALANSPRLIIADEPTGNLDPHTSGEVFALFAEVCREEGAAALVATHNLELAARLDEVWRLEDGRLLQGLA
jgi:lipoprotein-releasing system ATP-binding protein